MLHLMRAPIIVAKKLFLFVRCSGRRIITIWTADTIFGSFDWFSRRFSYCLLLAGCCFFFPHELNARDWVPFHVYSFLYWSFPFTIFVALIHYFLVCLLWLLLLLLAFCIAFYYLISLCCSRQWVKPRGYTFGFLFSLIERHTNVHIVYCRHQLDGASTDDQFNTQTKFSTKWMPYRRYSLSHWLYVVLVFVVFNFSFLKFFYFEPMICRRCRSLILFFYFIIILSNSSIGLLPCLGVFIIVCLIWVWKCDYLLLLFYVLFPWSFWWLDIFGFCFWFFFLQVTSNLNRALLCAKKKTNWLYIRYKLHC